MSRTASCKRRAARRRVGATARRREEGRLRASAPPRLALYADAPTRRRADAPTQSGFTLAGLIVILTIMAVLIAYTVPKQWSKELQRDRERQTIFVMKQYARSIHEWQAKHGGGFPTSLDQIKEARLPRMIRGPKGEYLDPLTGKVDWIMVPPAAYTQRQGQPGGPGGPGSPGGPTGGGMPGGGTTTTTGTTSTTGTNAAGGSTSPFNSAASPADYKGPFIGVRPPITGKAMYKVNNAENYEDWFYTVYELNAEISMRIRPSPYK